MGVDLAELLDSDQVGWAAGAAAAAVGAITAAGTWGRRESDKSGSDWASACSQAMCAGHSKLVVCVHP